MNDEDKITKSWTLRGTKSFHSPELFCQSNYKQIGYYNPLKSDVYSLGLCILYYSTLKILHYKSTMEKYEVKITFFFINLIIFNNNY